jgi:predicted small lipoprotein YifL
MLHSKITHQTMILNVKSFKASNTGTRHVVLALLLGAATMLTGCGQPGPLYLPKPPAKPVPAPAASTAPAPTPPAANQ